MDDRAGWMDFHDPMHVNRDQPSQHKLIWLWREGWAEPQLTSYEGMNPMMNANGLLWQPAFDGVGRPLIPATKENPSV